MLPGTAPAEWKDVFVLDAHTVQLGTGEQAVRIIGPAQQTLKRLQEPAERATGSEDGAEPRADDSRAADQETADPRIRVQARRRLAAVLIDGLPRPGALLAEQLTRLHLGVLLLRDEHPVDSADVAAGYSAAAVGDSRAVAARRSCLRQDSEAAVIICSAPAPQAPSAPDTPPSLPQEPVDIHVIFVQRAVAPARLSAAAARSQLVLPVVRHPSHWRIGPLLSRDRGPCPQCLQLHGTAADPHWEAVQTALAEQHPAATAPPYPETLYPEAPQSAAVLASLLAREIQLAVDGEYTPQTASRVIGLSTSTGRLSLEPVTPHPECVCRLRTPAAGQEGHAQDS